MEGSSRVLWRLLRLLRPHWRAVCGGLVLLACGTVFLAAGPLLIKRAIDVDIPARDLRGLALTCGAFLVIQGLLLGVRLWQTVLLERTGQQVIGDLRQALFDHLLESPVAFHDTHPPGKLISRVESDTEQLRRMFSSAVVVVIGSLMMFAVMFAVMATVDLLLTGVVAAVVALLLLATWWIQRSTAQGYLEVRRRMAELTGRLTEWLQGVALLQVLRRERGAAREMEQANREKFEAEFSVEWRICAFWNLVFLAEALGVAALVGLGGWRVLQSLATIGAIVMFIEYLQRLFEPIHQLAHELQGFMEAAAGARMIFELLDGPREPAGGATDWSGLQQSIRFEHVWFAYHGEQWVLRDASFELPRGAHWALVGLTGSGKSTIVNLLLRFYEPTRGRITIDGIDIRELPRERLRAALGYVPQELYLFPGSIADNLGLGQGTGQDDVVRAAEQLGVDPFIRALPEGYATEVAERGHNFSAGERQLLCATRALVASPEVLVLDEATSAVDPHTERELQAALRRLQSGRTSLTVAHRLSTILEADWILVLDEGRVIEQGAHDALLAAGGFYSRLFALQFQKRAG